MTHDYNKPIKHIDKQFVSYMTSKPYLVQLRPIVIISRHQKRNAERTDTSPLSILLHHTRRVAH